MGEASPVVHTTIQPSLCCLKACSESSDSDVITRNIRKSIPLIQSASATCISNSMSEDDDLSDVFLMLNAQPTPNSKQEVCVSIADSTTDTKVNSNPKQSVTVSKSTNTSTKRVWDKVSACVYCQRVYAKLPRHMEQKHKDEIEVAAILSFPRKSAERKLKWQNLRNRGNFHHNTEVLVSGQGSIIPVKRPPADSDVSAGDYLPCENCFAFLRRKDLWRHVATCKSKANQGGKGSFGRWHQAAGSALLPVSIEANAVFKQNILDSMIYDSVSIVVRNDDLIVQFGSRLFSTCANNSHQYPYVRQKMRELGRFLLKMREINKAVTGLSDCMKPTMFKDVVQAVQHTSKFNAEKGSYDIPSLALKLGHSLKKCAKIVKASALIVDDKMKRKEAEGFFDLCESEWNSAVSSLALQTLHVRKFNNPKRIPLAEDVKKVNQFLKEKGDLLFKSLESFPCQDTWRALAEVVLAQLVLFNRRRGGETERMELRQYTDRMMADDRLQEEVAQSLSSFERELTRTISRVEIRGKRGRPVAVLLPDRHKEKIECLNKLRDACKINKENKYLFARGGESRSPIRSADVLRKFSIQCNAKSPELLTSTSLRKHVATVSQILNLKDHELDTLANFLGHDIRIHREYYRLPENTIQIGKVSKILIELEKGTIQNFAGKSLEEIQMDVDEAVETEVDETQDMDIEHVEDFKTPVPESDSPASGGTPTQEWRGTGTTCATRKKKRVYQAVKRQKWSKEEREAIERQLGKFYFLKSLPGKLDCEMARQNEPVLLQRPWKQIKYYIKNHK